jgi:hypothetical protein
MDFGKWKFWQTEKREDVKHVTPLDTALNLETQLRCWNSENQDKIINMVLEQIKPGYHVHKNPSTSKAEAS